MAPRPVSTVLFVLGAFALLSCGRTDAELAAADGADVLAESWGFVATLGTDTTSVERVTRRGNRLVSDAVGRSPVVVRRHWEGELAPDGTLRRWTLDTHIPNAPPGEAELHHALEFNGATVRVVRQAGRDSTDRTVRNPYTRTVPWNAFVYATTELLFQAARGLPDTARIGQYFFEGWSEGRFGFARVGHAAGGQVTLRSTGLAGTGVGTLDADGRMVAYSGDGTTYKQSVRRVENVPDLDALLERFASEERATGVPRALSSRDTVRARIGAAQITIDYSRPRARGRTLLGALIPYGQVWRTGADAATQLTTTAPLRLGGAPLDAGRYTLWTLPSEEGVQLIINGESGQWGTRYRSDRDVARVPLRVDSLTTPVEVFTIAADSVPPRLRMEWGTFRWSAPIQPGG